MNTILLTPNERRVVQDRRDCYWLYVVANCHSIAELTQIKNPARLAWHDVIRVVHYYLPVNILIRPMQVR